jgi:hypothetical protein
MHNITIIKIVLLLFLSLVSLNILSFEVVGIQSGDNRFFYNNFYYTVLQLNKDNYLCFDQPLPVFDEKNSDYQSTLFLWEWVKQHDKCNKLKFNLFLSGDFDRKNIEKNIQLLQKIIKEEDIQLIISLGTVLSKTDLNYRNEKKTPKISLSIIDPILSKILSIDVKTYKDIGVVYIQNLQFKQIEYFYNKFKFKKLGLLFDKTTNGSIFSGLIHYRDYLLNNDVSIYICNTKEIYAIDTIEMEDSILSCIDELIENKIDAIYLSYQIGYSKRVLNEIATKLNKHKIVSLYQLGEFGVANGILLSYFPKNYNERNGYLYAKIIEKMVSGISLSEIVIDIEFEDFIPCYNRQAAKELNISVDDIECLY